MPVINKDAIIDEYTTYARSVVKISFVSPIHHYTEYFDNEYAPEFTYQMFGKKEKIFGYKNLEIRIVYSETSGHCYVKLRYNAVVNNLGLDFVADDIWSKIRPGLPSDYYRDYYEYAENQKSREVYLKDFGISKYKFACQTDEEHFSVFIARLCSLTEDGFKAFHRRFQTLILWYINGASLIDLDDSRWDVIYLYTYPFGKMGPPAVAGFCTVYKFYSYPDQIRARISQYIIFPQYRRCGVGIHFLRCVYNIIRDTIPNLKEITVEEPNEKFRMIRAINNVSTVFFFPQVMAKFKVLDTENIDFAKEIELVFKFSQKESQFIADLIMYMCASSNRNSNIKEKVILRLKERCKKQYIKTFKFCRDSIHYNRGDISSDTIRRKFYEYRDEFVRMVTTITCKICDNINVTKIV